MNEIINKLKNWWQSVKQSLSEGARNSSPASDEDASTEKKSLRRGLSSGLSFSWLLPLIAVALVIGLFFFLKNPFKIDWSINKTEKQTTLTVEEIKKISELKTASYYEEMLLEKRDTTKGFLHKNKHLLAVLVKGNLKVGFDLSQISEDDISIGDDQSIVITLPEAKVTDIITNPSDRTIVYGEKDKHFTENDINELTNQAKTVLVNNAREEGIFEKATEQGKKEMANLLKAMGYEKVTVKIKGE